MLNVAESNWNVHTCHLVARTLKSSSVTPVLVTPCIHRTSLTWAASVWKNTFFCLHNAPVSNTMTYLRAYSEIFTKALFIMIAMNHNEKGIHQAEQEQMNIQPPTSFQLSSDGQVSRSWPRFLLHVYIEVSVTQFLPISWTGWWTPISLFTIMIETSEVSGRIASSSCFKSTNPFVFTGKYVTSKPSASNERHESSTHLCSCNFTKTVSLATSVQQLVTLCKFSITIITHFFRN